MDLRQIEQRLEQIFSRASGWFPEGQIDDMVDLVKAGEPGVALENFLTQVEEYGATVPPDMSRELRDIASAMGLAVPGWLGDSTNS